jgi:predicted nucleic acid-binding protein
MRRIYLDSNILISHFSRDKAEETKRQMVGNALNVFADLRDVQLCTSMWAITEMVNVLVPQKKLNRGEVAEIESQLLRVKGG